MSGIRRFGIISSADSTIVLSLYQLPLSQVCWLASLIVLFAEYGVFLLPATIVPPENRSIMATAIASGCLEALAGRSGRT